MANNNVTRAPFGHACPIDRTARYHPVPLCLRVTPETFTPAEAARAGITRDNWPYGPNICQDSRNQLVEWALHEGLKLATPNARCLHWLTGLARRCRALRDVYGHYGVIDPMREMDHPTFWTRNGKPALILAQPYTMPPETWFEQIQRDWPVDIEAGARSPWYGARTLGVLITPAGAA